MAAKFRQRVPSHGILRPKKNENTVQSNCRKSDAQQDDRQRRQTINDQIDEKERSAPENR